jgi:hypothetical protein
MLLGPSQWQYHRHTWPAHDTSAFQGLFVLDDSFTLNAQGHRHSFIDTPSVQLSKAYSKI